MRRRFPQHRPAFSLFELLVVLAVLAFLLALLLPAIQRIREAAARAETRNNFKQLALATISCADANRNMLPPAFDKAFGSKEPLSLHIHILPYLEQTPLYRAYLDGKGTDDAVVPPYVSPTDPGAPKPGGIQNCAANLRMFSDKGRKTPHNAGMPILGMVEPSTGRFPASIPDGTSNTIFFATRYGVCGNGGSRFASSPNGNTAAFFGQNQARVKAAPVDITATFLLHPAREKCPPTPLMAHAFGRWGVTVALGDGSVRDVSPAISPETWNAAIHPADGLPLGNDW